MASFNALTSKDQEEYMKLHNRFEEKLPDILLPNDLFNGMEDGAETQAFTSQVLKVYGIYQTNNFDDGVTPENIDFFANGIIPQGSVGKDDEPLTNPGNLGPGYDKDDESNDKVCDNFPNHLHCTQETNVPLLISAINSPSQNFDGNFDNQQLLSQNSHFSAFSKWFKFHINLFNSLQYDGTFQLNLF